MAEARLKELLFSHLSRLALLASVFRARLGLWPTAHSLLMFRVLFIVLISFFFPEVQGLLSAQQKAQAAQAAQAADAQAVALEALRKEAKESAEKHQQSLQQSLQTLQQSLEAKHKEERALCFEPLAL